MDFGKIGLGFSSQFGLSPDAGTEECQDLLCVVGAMSGRLSIPNSPVPPLLSLFPIPVCSKILSEITLYLLLISELAPIRAHSLSTNEEVSACHRDFLQDVEQEHPADIPKPHPVSRPGSALRTIPNILESSPSSQQSFNFPFPLFLCAPLLGAHWKCFCSTPLPGTFPHFQLGCFSFFSCFPRPNTVVGATMGVGNGPGFKILIQHLTGLILA